MKRLVTTGAVALSILAVPAAAQAATQTGTVLNANRGSHRIEVVDSRHVVHSYTVAGRVGKRVRKGSKVAFQARGKQAVSLRVTGRSRKVAFYAKVVANGRKAIVLKLGDGRRFRVSGSTKKKHHAARHARAAGSIQLNIQGLQPGQTVLITETSDGAGNVTITLKIVPNADENGGEDQDAVGTVTAVGNSSITLDVPDSGPMTFQADSDLLDGVSVGDQVDVTYYQDTDGTLVADDIEPADDGSGDGSDDQDAIGTVTALGDSSITISADGGSPMTFRADPDLLDGVSVGDQVDVTYYQDTDGTLVADDVEPADDGSGDDSGDGSGDSGSGDSTPSGGDEQPSGPLTVLPPLPGGGSHRR